MSEQDCRRQAKPGRGKKECGQESRNRKCGLNKRNCRQGPGSFRAMCRGKCGNLGNIGNDESVTCRPHYPGDGTNPPSPLPPSVFWVTAKCHVQSQYRSQKNSWIRPDVFDHLRNLLPCALPCQAQRAGSTASTQHGARVTQSEFIPTESEGSAPPCS